MKDRSNNPSHHEWSLLPWSYISLHHQWDFIRWYIPLSNDCGSALIKLVYNKYVRCYITINQFVLSEWRKEGNVLFNNTFNTFYLWLYNDIAKRNHKLPLHKLFLSIGSKGYFICTIPRTGQHIPQSVIPARTRNSSMDPQWRIDPTTYHIYHRAMSRSSCQPITPQQHVFVF